MSSGNLYHDAKVSIAITPANGVAGQTAIEGVELDPGQVAVDDQQD